MVLNKIKLRHLRKKLKIKKKNIEIFTDITLSSYKMLSLKDNIYIGPNAKIYGKGHVTINDNVIIGPNVNIFSSMHDYNGGHLPYGFVDIVSNIEIGESVWIGANVSILPGICIGEGAIIGLGSIVTKDVPSLAIVAGNPATIINWRNKKEYEDMKAKEKFYLKKKLKGRNFK
ncbi:acyltransferase [Carnobacterium divergens]|uniref:acyltransferase n=1 Tax=Carnobacterium divergens TaxID=2748 RepID=UPI0039AE962E